MRTPSLTHGTLATRRSSSRGDLGLTRDYWTLDSLLTLSFQVAARQALRSNGRANGIAFRERPDCGRLGSTRPTDGMNVHGLGCQANRGQASNGLVAESRRPCPTCRALPPQIERWIRLGGIRLTRVHIPSISSSTRSVRAAMSGPESKTASNVDCSAMHAVLWTLGLGKFVARRPLDSLRTRLDSGLAHSPSRRRATAT